MNLSPLRRTAALVGLRGLRALVGRVSRARSAAWSERTRQALAVGVVAASGLSAWACGVGSNPPGIAGTSGGDGGGFVGLGCSTPNTGCACSNEGQQLPCGSVVMRSGDYATCSEGTRTCQGGAWSVCAGQYVTTQSVSVPAGRIRVQNLNAAIACADAGDGSLADPCDPLCTTFVDDPSGLDAGADSGLTINEAGVTLTGVPVPPAQCSGLAIAPNTSPTKDVTITSISAAGAPSPNTVQFSASLTPAGCYPGMPSFIWDINKYDVAQVGSSGLLTVVSPIAGPITVDAYAGSLTANVVSNVTVNVVDTTVAPAGYTNSQFGVTTGPADTIHILYPYPGTVFPLGLPPPLVQWSNGGIAANAVKVTLRFPSAGAPLFSWSEIVPESQTTPTPTLPAQPRATIPPLVWNDFQQTVVRNSGATGGDAVFAVQRSVGGTLDAEVPTTIHFASGQLKGNVFYNSYGTNLVQNFAATVKGKSFGAATLEVPANGTSPTVVVGFNDPSNSGAGCRVCHNVASSGARILSNSFLSNGSNGSGPTEATTFTYNPNLATPALIQGSESLVGTDGSNKFTFAALSPDGSYLFTSAAPSSAGGNNALFDLTGNPIASNVPPNLGAATPTFAADATHLAFNNYNGNANPLSAAPSDGRSLAMMDFTAPGTFSNFRTLYTPAAAAAAYSVWPAFLPPSENGVVFQNEVTTNGRDWAGTRSRCDGTGSCNNVGATAELWWVSTGAMPVATRLSNLNGGAYLPRNAATSHGTITDDPLYYEEVYNYEPTALPVTIGGYSWVAFTSRRLYGNVATINPYWSDPRFQDISIQPTTKKIWISAIAQNPKPGTDPSYPAFYLPGQELLAGNARAYFALSACETASAALTPANLCTSALDCCGANASPPTAVCQLDPPPVANPPTSHCVPTASIVCSADGAACSGDAQCCNYGTGSRCASGKCAPAPPLLTYSPATFVVSFVASCQQDAGAPSYPAWRNFYWESNTPNGTSISFTAQTSTDGMNWSAAVPIGTASPPPNVTPTWTAGPQTVNDALKAAHLISETYLKVTATLNPDATKTLTPALIAWQQKFDCEPSE